MSAWASEPVPACKVVAVTELASEKLFPPLISNMLYRHQLGID